MSLNKNLEKKIFDKRLVKWNMRTGRLSQEQLDQHINGLTDESDNIAVISLTNSLKEEVEVIPEEPANGQDETASALNGQLN